MSAFVNVGTTRTSRASRGSWLPRRGDNRAKGERLIYNIVLALYCTTFMISHQSLSFYSTTMTSAGGINAYSEIEKRLYFIALPKRAGAFFIPNGVTLY